MDRIERAFRESTTKAALIPFLNAADPTIDASQAFINALLQADSDIVEIGIPYSDPLADGPVIQASALRSIHHGFQLPQVFELTSTVRSTTHKGLILFTYYNPILQYGEMRFLRDAATAGADGVIVPDLPFEESEALRILADRFGISLVPLVTPTSSDERIAEICRQARGFVYCVSSLGVTGERAKMHSRLQDLVSKARDCAPVPVAVGFGVSSTEQAHNIAQFADGVIVGSAFIRRIDDGLSQGESVASIANRLGTFAKELKTALHV